MRYPTTLDQGADAPEIEPEEKPTSPERALWLSAIARVWDDAFFASDWFLRASESMVRNPDFDPDHVRNEARRWLTLDFGDWREDRIQVCDLAEISEPMLRNAARRKLAELKAAETENRTAEIVNLDTMFAKLLDGESTMDPADLDAALAELAALERAA